MPLGPNASCGTYIHDFVHSKNSRFKGKSKKQRIKQALGACMHKEETLDEKNWIAGAIKHPGAEKSAAKRAGMSTHAYMEKHKHDSGKSGSRARLGLTLSKMHHEDVVAHDEFTQKRSDKQQTVRALKKPGKPEGKVVSFVKKKVNELSDTLRSYKEKATAERNRMSSVAEDPTKPDIIRKGAGELAAKRHAGIKKAENKLKHEQLDELSKSKINHYLDKTSISHNRGFKTVNKVALANRKLNKKAKVNAEETQLDEISAGLLSKAAGRAFDSHKIHVKMSKRAITKPAAKFHQDMASKRMNQNVKFNQAFAKKMSEETNEAQSNPKPFDIVGYLSKGLDKGKKFVKHEMGSDKEAFTPAWYASKAKKTYKTLKGEETINEVTKSLLKRYIDKAKKSQKAEYNKPLSDEKSNRKYANRTFGIRDAEKKLEGKK